MARRQWASWKMPFLEESKGHGIVLSVSVYSLVHIHFDPEKIATKGFFQFLASLGI